tara:strand:- start:266 stop:526 length:261 start_codon:yes stop_codon:yes gene_type:complete
MGACLYINYIYGGKGAMVAKAIATVLLLFACFRIVVTASTTSWRTSTSITSIQYLEMVSRGEATEGVGGVYLNWKKFLANVDFLKK